MKTTQAWGWLVAGVLAAGLNASYYDGNMQWAHRVADEVQDRSEAVLSRVSDRVSEGKDLILARAEQLSGRTEMASCRLSTTLTQLDRDAARTDQDLARIQVTNDRQNVRLAIAEANREARRAVADARLHISFASFQPVVVQPMSLGSMGLRPITVRVAAGCPRVRVTVPQVTVPQISVQRVDIPRVSIPKIQ